MAVAERSTAVFVCLFTFTLHLQEPRRNLELNLCSTRQLTIMFFFTSKTNL